jgi:tetratricopeptide (TPR) repeat protein
VLSHTCVRPRAALAAMLCLGLWAPAFSQGFGLTVRGELKSSSPRNFSDYLVQLVDPLRHMVAGRADVRNDGYFEMRGVPAGEYLVVVTTLHGGPVVEQTVSLTATGAVEVRLPDTPVNRPGAGTISVKQLLHPPTKKAFRSFVEAQKFSSSGDYAKAVQALERAIEESPDYAEAHVNLGVQYIRTGRMEAAAGELKRAIAIAGPNSLTLCNLAWVQMRLGLRNEALVSVRAGLRLDQSSQQGHVILGTLLAADPATRGEAIRHLEQVADSIPSARRILAELQGK